MKYYIRQLLFLVVTYFVVLYTFKMQWTLIQPANTKIAFSRMMCFVFVVVISFSLTFSMHRHDLVGLSTAAAVAAVKQCVNFTRFRCCAIQFSAAITMVTNICAAFVRWQLFMCWISFCFSFWLRNYNTLNVVFLSRLFSFSDIRQ